MESYLKLLSKESFHFSLLKLDEELRDEAREAGCAHCDARLDCADYDRKPRGVGDAFRQLYKRRFSLCCCREGCRKRLTPFSVRFLGGQQHISATIVLCSAMLHGLTPRRQRCLETEFDIGRGISRAIVRHWQNWWKRLPLSAFWKTVRGRLPATLDARALPGSLLRVFKGNAGQQLCRPPPPAAPRGACAGRGRGLRAF